MKAKFSGAVTLSDLDPPNGYTLSGEGQGGPAGFASGTAKVALAEEDGGTVVRYEADAQVGGKLAQIGSRLIDPPPKSSPTSSSTASREKLGGETPPAEEPAPAAEEPVPGETAEAPTPSPLAGPRKSLPASVWISGVVAVALVIVILVLVGVI